MDFAGRSDTWIVPTALAAHGRECSADDLAQFIDAYVPALGAVLAEREARLCPGVQELLDALRGEDVVLGLGTGNFRRAAKAKLQPLGIWDYFLTGGFGDDAADRTTLLAAGLKRLREHSHDGAERSSDRRHRPRHRSRTSHRRKSRRRTHRLRQARRAGSSRCDSGRFVQPGAVLASVAKQLASPSLILAPPPSLPHPSRSPQPLAVALSHVYRTPRRHHHPAARGGRTALAGDHPLGPAPALARHRRRARPPRRRPPLRRTSLRAVRTGTNSRDLRRTRLRRRRSPDSHPANWTTPAA